MLTWTMRDARPPCRLEESLRVAHGVGVLEQAMIESHPVGVVEHRDAAELPDEQIRLVEVERKCLDAIAEGVFAGKRVGQRDDGLPFVEQPLGDVFPGIAVGPRHRMDCRFGHRATSLILQPPTKEG